MEPESLSQVCHLVIPWEAVPQIILQIVQPYHAGSEDYKFYAPLSSHTLLPELRPIDMWGTDSSGA